MHGCPPKHVKMGKFAPALGSTDNTSRHGNAQLSTKDDCWRSQWRGDALRKNHLTAKYEDTQQQTCKIYAINKYTALDGIKDK